MFEVGETVTDDPVPTDVPPQLPEYHFQLAPVPRAPPETDSVVELPLQIVVVPVILDGAVELLLTVTVTGVRVAETQPPEPPVV